MSVFPTRLFSSVQLLSHVQLFATPMDYSMPGFPVHHQFPEHAQTHVNRVGDAIKHLILHRPLLLLTSLFFSIRVFSNELVLPIFGTHFYLRARLLAWLLSPPFDSPFSPPDCLYLLFLFSTQLCESLCVFWAVENTGNWLLAGSVSLLSFPLLSSWPPLSPSSHFSSLCNSVNISEGSRLWRAHREVING